MLTKASDPTVADKLKLSNEDKLSAICESQCVQKKSILSSGVTSESTLRKRKRQFASLHSHFALSPSL
jgi:hypothetical protein